jgi:hypothetical protein
MTQKEIILSRLQNGEWLSSVRAVRELFILRLGARIWDLRAEGYQIEERRVEGKSYSEYRLRPAAPITLPPAFPAKPKVSQDGLFPRASASNRAANPIHRPGIMETANNMEKCFEH